MVFLSLRSLNCSTILLLPLQTSKDSVRKVSTGPKAFCQLPPISSLNSDPLILNTLKFQKNMNCIQGNLKQ